MQGHVRHFIDGSWVEAIEPRHMPRVSPATEEVTGRVVLGSAADVDRAAAAAAAAGAFDTFRR